MSRSYEIAIRLVNGTDVVPQIPEGMELGDTVRYVSPDGEVTIEFPEKSPFLDDQGREIAAIADSLPHELQREGDFTCHCTLTLPDQRKLGWSSGSQQSGGVTTVGHH